MNTSSTLTATDKQSAAAGAKSMDSEDNFDLLAMVSRVAKRKLKDSSMTREAFNLNREKLQASCAVEYRSSFPSVYGKTERLPSELWERIQETVDGFIQQTLSSMVHVGNVVSVRAGFAWDSKSEAYIMRTTAMGHDSITLKEQHFAATLALGAANKRLTALQAKNTPDLEREAVAKEQIAIIEKRLAFVKAEIAHQERLNAPTPTPAPEAVTPTPAHKAYKRKR